MYLIIIRFYLNLIRRITSRLITFVLFGVDYRYKGVMKVRRLQKMIMEMKEQGEKLILTSSLLPLSLFPMLFLTLLHFLIYFDHQK